ncbi:SAM-dependent methyltransferase, partial [Parabacteroides sp. OttesenSCG-928-K15]|nr:SAM-dependent methyltransferase [Parabacteroides sp. OttesenSCG-928-K15]
MKLSSPQKEIYNKERFTAVEAQRLAQEIAFGPVVFQVSRLMLSFGIFGLLRDNADGLTLEEITKETGLSRYAVQVLLESSLTIGTVLLKEERFHLAKAGWFLLTDEMARINMTFNQDVNYLGLYHLEEALRESKPAGLKVFGEWPTIYEGLSSLPEQAQKSWFAFDHYYSDNSFRQALEIVFS